MHLSFIHKLYKMQGDTTVISWLMVMTRKYALSSASFEHPHKRFRHYFRTQCIYVASRHSSHRLSKSRASLLASISSPIKAFRSQEAVPPHKEFPIPLLDDTIEKGPSTNDTDEKSSGSAQQQGARDEVQSLGETKVLDLDTNAFTSSPAAYTVPLSSSDIPAAADPNATNPDATPHRRVLTFRGTSVRSTVTFSFS